MNNRLINYLQKITNLSAEESNLLSESMVEKQLKKANIKINNAIIWGAVLVPVYCYLRGSRMNKIYNLGGIKSQWVFISWMGSFFVSLLFTPY